MPPKRKRKIPQIISDDEDEDQIKMPPKRKRKIRQIISDDDDDEEQNDVRPSTSKKEPRRAKKRHWTEDANYDHIGPSDVPKKKVRYKNHIFNQSVSFGR